MSKTQLFIPVMNARQRLVITAFAVIWGGGALYFWIWWAAQLEYSIGYQLSTIILGWMYLMSGYFLFFAFRMQKTDAKITLPSNLRVAMIVTKVPSEPWVIVKKTLEAMLSQKYPHDTWLADEQPMNDTLLWCKEHGVQVSTRFGISQYHQPTWPRRTKSKEGNLAYFYDQYGYERYDVVVQLDADHVPSDGYLEHMLRPFIDDTVGYVSAPSICDANATMSWGARARMYAESSMHGALQAGYSNGWAPLCIGSHYAVRTRALYEVGGIGPELAEDHSTTLLLNAHGWKGKHAFEAEAHGDGPATFADFMTQEFQWSRSLITLLLTLTPRYVSRLQLSLIFQFLFSQIWYPSFALLMLVGFLLPVWALINHTPIVTVGYIGFVQHSLPATVTLLCMLKWIQNCGWLRPVESKIISWEIFVFQLVRWPWIMWGSIAALVGVIRNKSLGFKVTPKGDSKFSPISLKELSPYLSLIFLFVVTLLVVSEPGSAQGYYYFVLLNLVTYAIVMLVIIVKHVQETYYAKHKTHN